MKNYTEFRERGGVLFLGDQEEFNEDKTGKWMYFFEDIGYARNLCIKAMDENIVRRAAYKSDAPGVALFYLNIDDIKTHKKVLKFFVKNDLIKTKKDGSFYNISFKLDSQSRAGEYKSRFNAVLKLSDLVDLKTKRWIYDKKADFER